MDILPTMHNLQLFKVRDTGYDKLREAQKISTSDMVAWGNFYKVWGIF